MATTDPVACTLTSEELRDRRNNLLRKVGRSLQETVEREGGFAFRFPPDVFDDLAQIATLERRCCSFLRISLVAEPQNGPVWLEMTGPESVREFLASFWS